MVPGAAAFTLCRSASRSPSSRGRAAPARAGGRGCPGRRTRLLRVRPPVRRDGRVRGCYPVAVTPFLLPRGGGSVAPRPRRPDQEPRRAAPPVPAQRWWAGRRDLARATLPLGWYHGEVRDD